MHVTLCLDTPGRDKNILLPSANLHLFQSMLYSLLPAEVSAWLHDVGYESGGRRLKLFAISWPDAAAAKLADNNKLQFTAPVNITISTHKLDLALSFVSGALNSDNLRIGNNPVICRQAKIERQIVQGDKLIVNTLSPVSCYEKISLRGNPYTIYFKPEEREFKRFIHQNLIRKFKLIFPDKEVPGDEFNIKPIGELKERVSMFKDDSEFPIKGWWGKFKLEGANELLQIALDCGIGARNSLCWGCLTKEEYININNNNKESRQSQNESDSDNLRNEHSDK